MSWTFIFNSFLMVLVGVFFLRIAGRKSISQMTLVQTVIMISIGSVIIQPIIETSILRTTVVTGIFVLSLIALEWIQLKSNKLEKFITGKSRIVIQNGEILPQELKKHRLTVDQLEMFLRQQGIANIKDVKTATIEPNGQLGYELKEDARPLTVGEFKKMLGPFIQQQSSNKNSSSNKDELFNEINQNHKESHPTYLQ
ncbi:DUF421 domain-containing protein [Radiobacillus kanasensis]|uniref:DUF421 domain-containing protein n=1 Tax=Radiobacillus kanasensis TaxID=2844358 RepID=UPI001E37C414|nr:DUF421 domain-containing protein [Radiobacillus kanasensis]UFT99455.1 DUF421 domain-containing protein [Radiobacillus kanasensis]